MDSNQWKRGEYHVERNAGAMEKHMALAKAERFTQSREKNGGTVQSTQCLQSRPTKPLQAILRLVLPFAKACVDRADVA